MARLTPTFWLENIDKLPLKEVMPGMRGRFVHSETMTLAFWEIDAGFDLPAHRHPHEQVSHMLEGEFELCIDGVKKIVREGAVSVIPGLSEHSGKSITFCRVLDIFYPKREDYSF